MYVHPDVTRYILIHANAEVYFFQKCFILTNKSFFVLFFLQIYIFFYNESAILARD